MIALTSRKLSKFTTEIMLTIDAFPLATKAWAKLICEAARPDYNLRVLVGHACLLDSLMPPIETQPELASLSSQYMGDVAENYETRSQKAETIKNAPEENQQPDSDESYLSSDSRSNDCNNDWVEDTSRRHLKP